MPPFRTTIEIDHDAEDAAKAREFGENVVGLFFFRDEVIQASVKATELDVIETKPVPREDEP